ncbi:hypothetical protein QVD17_29986 [Tagetes erecta]|uniref:Uncharacterized protein n=1 Tax=Tagetes erecta TaxID=13708 RepID=A0AAD8NN37_TARER|nr:hypothetical protein QVD17_29986 [Tagetes erecta]
MPRSKIGKMGDVLGDTCHYAAPFCTWYQRRNNLFFFSSRLNLDILSQKPNKFSPFSMLSIQILKSRTNPSSSATQTFSFKCFCSEEDGLCCLLQEKI